MNFKITPDFSSKVFSKVAQLAQEDFDLTEKQAQIDLCNGFVDFLQKESNLSPAMALGLIQNICERGAEWAKENATDKVAAEEVWSEELKLANEKIEELKLLISLEEIGQKEANPVKNFFGWAGEKFNNNVWEPFTGPSARSSGNNVAQGAVEGFATGIKDQIKKIWNLTKGYLGKGYNLIKDNMHTIAPLLGIGLTGALATKAIGGKDMPWWGAGLGGLAAAGGGKLLMDNTETGRVLKEEIRKRFSKSFQSGAVESPFKNRPNIVDNFAPNPVKPWVTGSAQQQPYLNA